MKFILVPPPIQFGNGEIKTNSMVAKQPITSHVNVAGVLHPVVSQSTAETIIYDPLTDYRQWYLPRGREYALNLTLDNSDIANKTWSNAEITNWVNETCTENVLMQRAMYGVWTVAFSNHVDYNAWQDWWRNLVKNYQIVIDAENTKTDFNTLEHEVNSWCIANLQGLWEVKRNFSHIKVWVKDKSEAAFCRLRWADAAQATH